MLDGAEQTSARQRFNLSLKEAHSDGVAGRLAVGGAVEDLVAVDSLPACMEAVALCLDVMSADGVANDEELKLVNAVAKRLGVDATRFEELKDKQLAAVSGSIRADTDYYALLGIDPSWNQDQVRSHLNRLYAQWNSRAEALSDPERRSQAETMLEVIARAREKLVE